MKSPLSFPSRLQICLDGKLYRTHVKVKVISREMQSCPDANLFAAYSGDTSSSLVVIPLSSTGLNGRRKKESWKWNGG